MSRRKIFFGPIRLQFPCFAKEAKHGHPAEPSPYCDRYENSMGHVKEILERTPPPILYHYTTQQGLLGIIRDKEIWATHTQYLNDEREFLHAMDVFAREISTMRSEGPLSVVDKACLDEMERVVTLGLESVHVCVCSFSERGDVLSQWRGYGGGTSGFAVGFSGGFLSHTSRDYGWLVPAIYDQTEQRSFIRTLLQDVLGESAKTKASATKEGPRGIGNILEYLPRYAPILKHHSFSEEKEWRIVTRPLGCTDERFDYRPGSSMLIPYFRLPLGDQKNLGIKEIVIGPTPHPIQSREAIEGLLYKHGIHRSGAWESNADSDTVKIRLSEIPYRSW